MHERLEKTAAPDNMNVFLAFMPVIGSPCVECKAHRGGSFQTVFENFGGGLLWEPFTNVEKSGGSSIAATANPRKGAVGRVRKVFFQKIPRNKEYW